MCFFKQTDGTVTEQILFPVKYLAELKDNFIITRKLDSRAALSSGKN